MSKRKLTDHQLRRISNKQKKSANEIDEATLGPQQEGLIISHYGQQLEVESASNQQSYRCYARSNLPSLACGDKVLWRRSIQENVKGSQTTELSGVIESILPRRSIIERPHTHRGVKPIAANIDTLVIVFASEPEPFENLIDRYLIAATHANLKPLLVLNKIDILNDYESYLNKFSVYAELSYDVIAVSSNTLENIEALLAHLNGSTSIFVGQSGVGKSSLLNAINPQANTIINTLSETHNTGRHTTTTSRLYHLPNGGDIIDSPGIREFGLWHLEKENLASGFIEFNDFIGQCKFRDCTHFENIKGCAIQQAASDGKINPQRLASYFSILKSIDDAHIK